MMELAVKYINKHKPKFAIVCGDLVNAYPKKEKLKKRAEEVKVFKKYMG